MLQKYNAIHNISIPQVDIDPPGKRLFGGDVGAIFVTDVMMPG